MKKPIQRPPDDLPTETLDEELKQLQGVFRELHKRERKLLARSIEIAKSAGSRVGSNAMVPAVFRTLARTGLARVGRSGLPEITRALNEIRGKLSLPGR